MSDNRRPPTPGGDLEFALLAALWAREGRRASARELHDEVGQPRGIVYTTVAKVLDRLVDKRLVKRRRAGRAYIYAPAVKQAETQRAMVRGLIEQIAGGDPEPAVAALIGAMEDVSPDLLEQLAAELKARKGGR